MSDLLNTLKAVEEEKLQKLLEETKGNLATVMQKTFTDLLPTLRKMEDDLIAGMVKTIGPDAESLRPYFRQTIENEAKKKIVSEVQEMIAKTFKK
jgi:hypothetical protein